MGRSDGIRVQHGSPERPLGEATVRTLLEETFADREWDGKRLLVIIPDDTRTAPIPLFFRVLNEIVGARVPRLDYLIALGTHPPMKPEAIDKLLGMKEQERRERFPKTEVYNHEWHKPQQLKILGHVTEREMANLSGGLLAMETPVAINKLIFDYDHLLICGPVFPHEVAGFSGGAKYLYPGIAGPQVIHNTHWLGAVAHSMDTIGVKDTAVRRVLHRAADFVRQERPVTLLALVMKGHDLHGLYIGDIVEAWEAAADLSAQVNIVHCPHPFQAVLSQPKRMYQELWTAAKAMYKTEPVVADGGELIIYAPQLDTISQTHGEQIRRIGYHVRDYYLAQWEKFRHVPLAVMAHSTHVKGKGYYEDGREEPRIRVTLATGIAEEICREINLGYRDPQSIDPADFQNREDDGVLHVANAGEYLYRLE